MGARFRAMLLLLCSWVVLSLASLPFSSDADCPLEPLPSSFNSLSYLGFNNEFHILREFYVEELSGVGKTRVINFNLTETSAFRFYIEPHYVDLDILLQNSSRTIDVC